MRKGEVASHVFSNTCRDSGRPCLRTSSPPTRPVCGTCCGPAAGRRFQIGTCMSSLLRSLICCWPRQPGWLGCNKAGPFNLTSPGPHSDRCRMQRPLFLDPYLWLDMPKCLVLGRQRVASVFELSRVPGKASMEVPQVGQDPGAASLVGMEIHVSPYFCFYPQVPQVSIMHAVSLRSLSHRSSSKSRFVRFGQFFQLHSHSGVGQELHSLHLPRHLK
ncbi:hypothetical protein V8E51_018992 [Hyaloscypha variabilis]